MSHESWNISKGTIFQKFYLFSTGYFIKEIENIFPVFPCESLRELEIVIETFALLQVQIPTAISRSSIGSKLPLSFAEASLLKVRFQGTNNLFPPRFTIARTLTPYPKQTRLRQKSLETSTPRGDTSYFGET